MKSASTFNAAYYRSYSRLSLDGVRENYEDTVNRVVDGLQKVGKLDKNEKSKLKSAMLKLEATASGRALWYAGTNSSFKPQNYYGLYNCVSIHTESLADMEMLFYLQMLGCGVGAVLEQKLVDKLPKIENYIHLQWDGEIGDKDRSQRQENTTVECLDRNTVKITVGDSKEGWSKFYRQLLELAIDCQYCEQNGIDHCGTVTVIVNISNIRKSGEKLKGFGGTANPTYFKKCFEKVTKILNKAAGRYLTQLEVTLLIDEPSLLVVSGNVRRSAGIRQYDYNSPLYKQDLWQPGEDGVWRIDPERDALRMANHTLNFHRKPSFEEIQDKVQSQFYSGEGAIMYTPEVLARANADLLPNRELKNEFIQEYEKGNGKEYLLSLDPEMDKHELNHRINRYGTNPCAEIEGKDFLCNLSEVFLNNLDPANLDQQKEAFEAAALAVAALLHQNFTDEKMQYSRELDPIVGVGITGLFDFFVNAIGVDYAQWMVENRPMDDETRGPVYAELEQRYLNLWYRWVEDTITEYCNKHELKKPNRFTCVKPSGTLSLLTGASPGWHPPKASHMIRRITFSKEDPIAMAYNAMGYRITPAHSDTDENGNLLDDPWDSRVNEWLVEIPITTTWGHLEGADEVKLENIPATAQMGLWKQVQIHWTGHNTSATIEFRENEIDSLSQWIYDSIQNNDGAYTSVAMLARFDNYQSFPRLPFEPISKEVYEKYLAEIEQNQVFDNFDKALAYFDQYYLNQDQVQGPSGCDSDKCLIS